MKAESLTLPFTQQYLDYVGQTEAPIFYHRWSCLSMVGAYLGRQFSFSHGHFNLHTNLYVMLIGDPGTRKSTAIKLAKKILIQAGYETISADKTSKEKFMLDLAGEVEELPGGGKNKNQLVDTLLDDNYGWEGLEDENAAHEMYIACDEFNDFIGLGNLEFVSLLGNLWDFDGVFKNRIKTGKSVSINNPTVSILGGNTATSFANAFPPETLGQGFFSRLLLIHGESTGKLITFPKMPPMEATAEMVTALQKIKTICTGKATLTPEAEEAIDGIYKSYKPLEDQRFKFYASRRLTHLLKLTLIIAATHYSKEITKDHVIEANTILTHTETYMSKALGEFGRARGSDITHKIMSILSSATMPMSISDLWPHLASDLDKLSDLGAQVHKLLAADKIQNVGSGKFLNKARRAVEVNSEYIDYKYLTTEERGMQL